LRKIGKELTEYWPITIYQKIANKKMTNKNLAKELAIIGPKDKRQKLTDYWP